MTKIEEVADRLKAVALADDGPTMDEAAYWVSMARAAVETLREPTEEMCSTIGRYDAASIWRDMIDAILNEKP